MATLRERNNEARRAHYQRQKEREEWLLFEHHALNEHVRRYGHVAWHASVLPENELYAAGLIHDFNQHRMNRIRLRREREGKAFQYRDYGLDILAKSPSGTYHACQAKHYTTRKVTANDVGTFLAILMGQLPNAGYLYTSGPVEVNFRECVLNSGGRIVHHALPFKAPRAAPPVAEPSLALRPYQKAAIEAVAAPGKNVLDMACGLGKTVILGHVLKATPHAHVICAAPLRVSVQNLADRLGAFLPTHRHLLVDSDAGGTTDPETVRAALADASPLVVYTTFASLQEVVHPLATQNEYLVVDEVHNVVQRAGMGALVDAYANSLCLSATVPEEFYDQVDATCAYRYSLAEGIRDGYICDYEIVLPYVVTADDGSTCVDVRVPAELDADAWIPKALFLATGMFLYGCRRCVVYLPSCDDCDAFKAAMRAVMERYHGSTLWCESVTHAVGAAERVRLLNAFQTDDAFDKYVIASVRILDEAVDLPACDSEFITHVGDATSDIRTVQRLLRGARLDPANPSKKNHLFLWTDETSRAVNALSLLKEADPTFHAKMRVLHADYDGTHQATRRQAVQTQMGELSAYLEVRCTTLAERWEARRLEWVAQYERLGRVPKQNATDADEKRAANWQNTMRRGYKHHTEGNHKTITLEQVQILAQTPGWCWAADAFENGREHWMAQYQKLGRPPRQTATDADEKRAAYWQHRMRKAHIKSTGGDVKTTSIITSAQIQILTQTPGWRWAEPDAFENGREHWVAQYQKLGRVPKQTATDPDEKWAANWQSRMRWMYNKNTGEDAKTSRTITAAQIDLLAQTPGWRWAEPDAFESGCEHWVAQYQKLGRPPKRTATDPNEKRAANWQHTMRVLYSRTTGGDVKTAKTVTAAQIDRLSQTPGWRWAGR